jgi:hypothetical protein
MPKDLIAQIPIGDEHREKLLRMFRPIYPQVFASGITIGYRVPQTFVIPDDEVVVEIYGEHRRNGTQALLCSVDGCYTQASLQERFGNEPMPRVRPLHITISTAKGVKPSAAGEIDESSVTYFDTAISFRGKPRVTHCHPLPRRN